MASGCYLCLSIPLFQQFSLRDFNNNNSSSLGYILKGRLVVGLPSVSRSQTGNNSCFSSLSVSLLWPLGWPNRQSTVEGGITAERATAPMKPQVCAPLKPNTTPAAQHTGCHMTPARWRDNSSYMPSGVTTIRSHSPGSSLSLHFSFYSNSMCQPCRFYLVHHFAT